MIISMNLFHQCINILFQRFSSFVKNTGCQWKHRQLYERRFVCKTLSGLSIGSLLVSTIAPNTLASEGCGHVNQTTAFAVFPSDNHSNYSMTLYSETPTSSSGFLMSNTTLCNCPGVNSNFPLSAYSSFTGMPSSRPISNVS